ncbi:MAG: DNA translocase FtsK 4TM domain-containing protein, partial [Oscillospiraceae bacterium]|nr:DNA translocase FtsK 4TM domain-containing protein [Oscillospiraceae bacterium]
MAEASNKKRTSGSTPRKKTQAGKKAAETEKLKRKKEEKRRTRIFVFFILTLFALIGCFTSEGWFIWFFREFVQGLIGKGFYLLPVVLLCCALLPALRREGIKSRTVCLLVMPVILGAIIHLFACTTEFRWSWALPGELYRAGTAEGAAGSGGLIGGLLAMGCRGLFNMLGASAVLLIAFVFLLLGAFNINFGTIAEWYRSRPEKIRDDYEDDYEEQTDKGPVFTARAAKTAPEQVTEAKRYDEQVRPSRPQTRRTVIDIPMDDDPPRLKKGRHGAAAPTEPDSGMIAGVLAGGAAKPPTPIGRTEVGRFAADAAEAGARGSSSAETRSEAAQTVLAEAAKSREEDKAAKAADELEKKKAAAEVADSIEKNLAEPEEVKYVYPPLDLLTKGSGMNAADGQEEMSINAKRLSATIKSFGIAAEICNVTRGPTVTRYEVELEQGVKLNKLTNLSDDIALALGATGVRIAPIPGKISIVGIEVPNKMTNTVFLRDVIDTPAFKGKESRLTFAIGKDIGGTPIVGDIASLPHMLIAGTTGSGKSVCMNSLIISLLYRAKPEEVKLIMVDPKMVELSVY